MDSNNSDKKTINKKRKKSEKGYDCCICFEKHKSYIIKTKCKHMMCLNCLVKLRKVECPMCRGDLKKDLPKSIQDIIVSNNNQDQNSNDNRRQRYSFVNNMSNNGYSGFYTTNISINDRTVYDDTQFFRTPGLTPRITPLLFSNRITRSRQNSSQNSSQTSSQTSSQIRNNFLNTFFNFNT